MIDRLHRGGFDGHLAFGVIGTICAGVTGSEFLAWWCGIATGAYMTLRAIREGVRLKSDIKNKNKDYEKTDLFS